MHRASVLLKGTAEESYTERKGGHGDGKDGRGGPQAGNRQGMESVLKPRESTWPY